MPTRLVSIGRFAAIAAVVSLVAAWFATSACSGGGARECPLGPCPLKSLLDGDARSAAATMARYDQGPAREIGDDPREKHLKRVRQLTFGGQNAECYFSFEGDQLCFQSTRGDFQADQIFTMDLASR